MKQTKNIRLTSIIRICTHSAHKTVIYKNDQQLELCTGSVCTLCFNETINNNNNNKTNQQQKNNQKHG